MYPWEKEKSSDGEPENQGFPWSKAPPQADADFEIPPLNEREESAVQLMIQTAREQPWVADPRLPILAYRQEDAQQPPWVPFAAMAAGAACLGGLLVFFLSQPPAPDSSKITTISTTHTLEKIDPLIASSASTPTGTTKSALLLPTDPEAYLNQQQGTGRDNPFKDTIPPPPLPKPAVTARATARIKPIPPTPPPQPVFTLVSLAISRSDRVAIIQVSNLNPTPSVHEVSPGDQVAGWQVRSVTSDRVLLAKGKKTQILSAQ